MKKTNFTFFRTGGAYTLKALFLFVLFSLSLSSETVAQASLLDGHGLSLVDKQEAYDILKSHASDLKTEFDNSAQSEADEVYYYFRIEYSKYLISSIGQDGFGWILKNSYEDYLAGRNASYSPQYKQDATTVYNEMIERLRS
jgi:hypothetical protein